MDDGGITWITRNGQHIPIIDGKIGGRSTNDYMNEKIRNGGTSNFNNRKKMTSHIKEQINVDLDKVATEKQFAPRRGINIDSRKMTENELTYLKTYLAKNNIRIESNGVYDYFITFKK